MEGKEKRERVMEGSDPVSGGERAVFYLALPPSKNPRTDIFLSDELIEKKP